MVFDVPAGSRAALLVEPGGRLELLPPIGPGSSDIIRERLARIGLGVLFCKGDCETAEGRAHLAEVVAGAARQGRVCIVLSREETQ